MVPAASDSYDFDESGERANYALAVRPSPSHPANIQADVLAQILHLLSSDLDVTWIRREMWDWVCVTEVCRYWRAVAVETANLWSYLGTSLFDSSKRTSIFLLRSKNSDLTIDFGGHNEQFENLKLALKNMHRIRHLSVDITLNRFNHLEFSDLFNQHAHRMQSMALRVVNHDVMGPYNLLPITTPGVLRTLELCYINLSSSLSCFSKLISLSIRACNSFSLSEVLTVLEASPNLSSLSMVSCSIQDSSLSRTVHLPNLTNLHLDCFNFSEIYDLLLHIEVPNLEEWIFKSQRSLVHNDMARLSVISRLLDLKGENLNQMQIKASIFMHFIPVEMRASKKASTTDYKTSLRLTLTDPTELLMDNVVLQDGFRRLLEIYGNHIARAKDLLIEDMGDALSVDDWRTVFRLSVCVEVVHANIMNEKSVGLNCLMALGAHPPGDELQISCPKLDHIDICWYNENSGFDAVLSALEEVLRTRSVHGLPVRKVSFLSQGYMSDDERIKGFERFEGFSQWVEVLDWRFESKDSSLPQ